MSRHLGGYMRNDMFDSISDGALVGSVGGAFDPEHSNMLHRWQRHHDWWQQRQSGSIHSYCRSVLGRIGPEVPTRTKAGRVHRGVNFASQDYLSLSSHPEILEAAKEAVDRFGVHSAGSAALMGNTVLSLELEQRLAKFLGYADCTVFPTGWA